jgi:hypothetical protein
MSIWWFSKRRRRARATALVLVMALVTSVPAHAASSTEARLRALEELVRSQQSEIKQLRGELKQQRSIDSATQAQAERAEEQAKSVARTSKGADWVSKFTPFGDIRVRHEGFYNQPIPKKGDGSGSAVTARNRERLRYRLGLKYTYSDEVSATVRLASGDPNDPISTNETLDGNFGRKHINLDWAFFTLTPGKTFGIRPGIVSVTAGKFPNPMFRVGEMVFDEDLSPEGFSETVQLLDKPIGALDQVKLHAEQWTFKETSNGEDGWMFGGQVNPTFHLGDVLFEGGLAQYSWLNPDSIAVATSRNSTAFTSSGAPVANSSFNSQLKNTNLVVEKTIQPPDVNGKTPASFKSITGFQSGFNQSNLTLAATLPNVLGTMPIKLYGDYVYNWDAVNDDAHGVMGGVRLGSPKSAGDWAAGLAYEYLMQEAVLSPFTASDFGNAGTNQQGPIVQLDYQLFDPLTLTARGFFTKYITAPVDINNRMQVRFQIDALLRF